jgi:hypothetical protein
MISDLVWIVLAHDYFLIGEYNKLWERNIEPCEILQKIKWQRMPVTFSNHLETSNVFNIKPLTPCFVDANRDSLNSMMSIFQSGETDAYQKMLSC